MKVNDLKNFQKKENGDLEIQIIDIQFLTDFSNQPFKVRTDLQMYDLMKSIENNGVLVPLIVRSSPNGNGYEIISGHRRKEACKLLGINEIPVIVREIDDCDAVIAMIDSNLQREHIRISEKAFAYRMKLEVMKSQGKRNDLTSSQVGTKLLQKSKEWNTILRADERLAKEIGESRNQIARYIRLTKLITKILDMIDEGEHVIDLLKDHRGMIRALHVAVSKLILYPDHGGELYSLITEKYMKDEKIENFEEYFCSSKNISRATYNRLHRLAIRLISQELWRVPSNEYEMFLRVIAICENDI